MPWIESHDSLVGHHKVDDLCEQMGWDVDTAIGKLHRLWYWCMSYAENGDLRDFSNDRLGKVVGLEAGEMSNKFVKAMKNVKLFDKSPHFRVHNWWKYAGTFLRSKYKRSPQKWRTIRELYCPGETEEGEENVGLRNRYVTANQPTNQPLNLNMKGRLTAAEQTRQRLESERLRKDPQ